MWNLVSSPFGGTVFPVNSHRPSVLGIKAYPSISEVPARVDLAVIVAPAPEVPGIIRECVEAEVEGAMIISAGFRETGPEGAELERQALEEARRGRMRIIGPNCLGVMKPPTGLNATFAGAIARPGNVALLSQSGALLTAILDRELYGEHRVLGARQRRLHDGRRLGRPDPLSRRRPLYEEHRHLHGVGRRRPLVPLGGPRSSPDQTDNRDQSRTHGGRR